MAVEPRFVAPPLPQISPLPEHVAIIMDGNGRWAQQRSLARHRGHRAGAENIRHVVERFTAHGVPMLTVFAFSTENWGRPRTEVDAILRLGSEFIDRHLGELHRQGVRLQHIGDAERLPRGLQARVRRAVKLTRGNCRITLNVAFNYGGRADIVNAVRALMADGARPEDGVGLFLVPKGAPGLTVKLLPTMDQTRKLCEVTLADVRVPAAAVLGAPAGGWPALARVLDRATVALCAEMCGGAQKVLEMTTEYAKIRVAFGKPIGTYQGVKHKAADMLVESENSKSLTYYAAWAVDEDVPEAALAASMAKAYVSDAYRRISAAGIQLHGGIGFTWEHDLHLYFKRAKASEFTFGDATYHRERVAQLINL